MAEDESEADDDSALEKVAAGAVTFLTLGVGFGLLALGNPFFWVAFPVGFGGGMPLAVGLARWYESNRGDREGRSPASADGTDAALAELRDRYARGELTDAEFEARVERLLETESIPDAKAYAERGRAATDSGAADAPSGADPVDRSADRPAGPTDHGPDVSTDGETAPEERDRA